MRIKDRSGCIICWTDRAIRDSKSDGKEGRGEGAALWPAIKRRAKGHEIKGEGRERERKVAVVDTRGGDSANQVAADWRC